MEHEVKEFEYAWRREMPSRYRHPSHRLLQLKQVERAFVAAEDYGRARAAHAEFARELQIEQEAAQRRLYDDYRAAGQRMRARQQGRLEKFDAQRSHARVLLDALYRQDREAEENRAKVAGARRARAPGGGGMAGAGRAVARPRRPLNDLLLLPLLKAPNDPEVLEEQERVRREDRRRKLAFQKQNAEATLAALTLDLRPMAAKTEEGGMVVAQGEEEEEEEQTSAEPREAHKEEEERAIAEQGPAVEDAIMVLTEVVESAPM
jgi:hypothetical protein